MTGDYEEELTKDEDTKEKDEEGVESAPHGPSVKEWLAGGKYIPAYILASVSFLIFLIIWVYILA